MLNFFKTKTFKVGSLVVAFALAFTLSVNAVTYMPIKTGGVENVKAIQTLVGAVADGKAGPKTMAAIATWQAANGLVADGKFGPASAAKANGAVSGNFPAGCTSAAGYSSTTGVKCDSVNSNAGGSTGGTLAGMFGNISTITQLSQYSNEEVGGGQDGVKVMGFEVEASNDGDIKLTSVKLTFDNTGNASGDSDRLEDYIDTVTVMMGSTKVGSSSADDFTKDSAGIYSKTIQLDNAIVKADQKASFYVAVDAVGNLDSGDIDSDSMTVGLVNVRYMDGSGVTTTDADTAPGGSGTGGIEYDQANDGVAISFVSFSSAADTELKFSTDSTPDSKTVEVDTTENTDDVSMLKGQIEVEGDSDVWLDELPFTITVTGESPTALANNVTLTIDGKTFNETVPTTAASSVTVTFDDLDLDLAAGKTVKFSVLADMNDIEDTSVVGTDFDEGDTMTISLTTTNRASVVAENEEGDPLTDSTEMTGSVTGNEMVFRTEGVNVVMGTPTYGKTTDTNGVVTQLTYTIPVAVTAFGDTLYMGQSGQFAATATASNSFAVVFENSSTPTTADVTSSATIAVSTSNALVESNGYVLPEGTTKNFTIEVTLNTPGLLGAVSAGNYRARIDELRVFTGAGLESAATATNNVLLPTTSYRTDFKYITS